MPVCHVPISITRKKKMYTSKVDAIIDPICPEKCGSEAVDLYSDWDDQLFSEEPDTAKRIQELENLLNKAVRILQCMAHHIEYDMKLKKNDEEEKNAV